MKAEIPRLPIVNGGQTGGGQTGLDIALYLALNSL
jgi:hypothetical protein